MRLPFFSLLVIINLPLHAAPPDTADIFAIPRLPSGEYREDGVFRGGTEDSGGIRSLKRQIVPREGGERWTIEFAPTAGRKAVPQFQLKLVKAESFQRSDGTLVVTEPAKILLFMRGVHGGGLAQRDMARALKKSHFIKEIIPYPPIEDGDMAVEFVLSRETLISPYHPRYAENQIVLDLK